MSSLKWRRGKGGGLNLKTIICTLCLWGWGFHAKAVFFVNIFSVDLHFDVLIIEPF